MFEIIYKDSYNMIVSITEDMSYSIGDIITINNIDYEVMRNDMTEDNRPVLVLIRE